MDLEKMPPELAHMLLQGLKNIKKEDDPRDLYQNPEIMFKAYSRITDKLKFEPGEFVTWKQCLQNKNKPTTNHPAIVVQMLEQPLYDSSDDSASPYYREPLDMIVGVLSGDNNLMLFHVDSRRFRKYTKEQLESYQDLMEKEIEARELEDDFDPNEAE